MPLYLMPFAVAGAVFWVRFYYNRRLLVATTWSYYYYYYYDYLLLFIYGGWLCGGCGGLVDHPANG
jgi:hypothetical protein